MRRLRHRPRGTARVGFALLATFALLAAACGGESATETSDGDNNSENRSDSTTTSSTSVEINTETASSNVNTVTSTTIIPTTVTSTTTSTEVAVADDNQVEVEAIENQVESNLGNVVPSTTIQTTKDEPLTTTTAPATSTAPVTTVVPATTAPSADVPRTFSVVNNVGPDGVAYNPAFVKVTPKSGVIHNHRWVGQYFLADYKPSCSPVLDDGSIYPARTDAQCASPEFPFVEERIFVNTRSPLDEPSQADYTPRYSYAFGLPPHPERGYYRFQWIDDYVPIKANADLRIRNTKTGKTEHWRIHSVQPLIPGAGATEVWDREAHLLGFTCGAPSTPSFCEQPPGLEVGDKYWKHLVYTCFYGRDGVEFPAGMGRASVSIAFEVPTVRGGDTPSGMGWMPYRNNHTGWNGKC